MANTRPIILGGTIAAGKSTIGKMLSKKTGFSFIQEIDESDALQKIILSKLYEGVRIDIETVEYFFVATRACQYQESSGGIFPTILDRGIWEDYFFAKLLPIDHNYYFPIFLKLWKNTIKDLIRVYGKPKLYVYLKVDWESFKNRLFTRNREAEVNNFTRNEEYFKNLLNIYNNEFVSLLNEFGIDLLVVDTSRKSKEDIIEVIMEKI